MTSVRQDQATGGSDVLGLAAGIIGAALFSTKPIFIKLVYADGVDALTLLALRMLLALPFYLAIGAFAWRHARDLTPRLWVAIAANGLLGYYIASYLDFLALEDITAQLERLILFTYPIFVVLLGAAFFNQPFRRWTLPALAVAYAGLALVFLGNQQHAATGSLVRGSLLVLGAAFCFSLFQLFGRRLVSIAGAQLYTSVAMSSAGIGLLTHFTIMRPLSDLVVPGEIMFLALAIAIFSTVLPSYLINYALGRIGAGTTAMAGNCGPLFTIVMSAMLLGEPFGWLEATGTALVIAGMVLFSKK